MVIHFLFSEPALRTTLSSRSQSGRREVERIAMSILPPSSDGSHLIYSKSEPVVQASTISAPSSFAAWESDFV